MSDPILGAHIHTEWGIRYADGTIESGFDTPAEAVQFKDSVGLDGSSLVSRLVQTTTTATEWIQS